MSEPQKCRRCPTRTRADDRLCPPCRNAEALPAGEWRPVGVWRTMRYFPHEAA